MEQRKNLCLCFPCIIYYLEGYIEAITEYQFYPVLQRRGFTAKQQREIASEWYWISVERETQINDYLGGFATPRDGCNWRRPPPPPRPLLHRLPSAPSSPSSKSDG